MLKISVTIINTLSGYEKSISCADGSIIKAIITEDPRSNTRGLYIERFHCKKVGRKIVTSKENLTFGLLISGKMPRKEYEIDQTLIDMSKKYV